MKYVEVDAVSFISSFVTQFLSNTDMIKDVFEDGHYVLRICDQGIEIAYPGDPVLLMKDKSFWHEPKVAVTTR